MNKEVLKNIGFEDKEVDIYLALLELGESSVTEIAKWTNIKRPTCYVVLDSLLKKGFIHKVMSNKKTYYLPQSPKRLESVAAVNLSQIKAIMPDLEILDSSNRGDKPRVLMFEGKDKLDTAYEDLFSYKGEIVYMGNLTAALDIFKESYKKLGNIEYSESFSTRVILDDTEISRSYAKKNDSKHHQTRFIPKNLMPFDIDIAMYGNKTIITSVSGDYFSISIQDKKMTSAFKTIFEVMWLQLSK